jgi:hypothetical protein
VTRKQRLTRVVYGLYVTVLAVFVASNIVQVARVVFATPSPDGSAHSPTRPPDTPKVGPACADALTAEIRAIDVAQALALVEPNVEAAEARYATERRSPSIKTKQGTTDDPRRACANDPSGADAIAAVARLDRIAETHAVHAAGELSTVRLAAQSFIRDVPR